jgi:replicative DNA helicase
MLCSRAEVNAHKMRRGYVSQDDWAKLSAEAGALSDSEIYIDDSSGINILSLRAKARRLRAQKGIRLVVIDYLQLMESSEGNRRGADNRQQEISVISRSLKSLARELNIPVIAISQLNRAVDSREDHRPRMSDLRESGAIEQDADLICFLFREEYYRESERNKGTAEVIVAKQRNGPTGTVKLTFQGEFMKFRNLSYQPVIG